MIKRPGRNESEEELLQFQEEFLKKSEKPSVTIKKLKNDKAKDFNNEIDNNKNEKETTCFKKTVKFQINDDDMDAAKRLDAKDKEHISEILQNVQEKPSLVFPVFPVPSYKLGFPSVPQLNTAMKSGEGQKKSLFAQNFKRFNPQNDFGTVDNQLFEKDIHVRKDKINQSVGYPDVKKDVLCSASSAASLDPTQKTIHEENLEIISRLNKEQIYEAQKNLLSTLDPKLVSLLKSKNSLKTDSYSSVTPDVIPNIQNDITDKQLDSCNAIAEPDKNMSPNSEEEFEPHKEFNISKDFVHMDIIEKEKLSWMKSVPVLKYNEDANCLPRFDFEGSLVKENNQPTYSGLYHHGDDPSLPGYTLLELFHMVRSNFSQQRIFGLKLLTKVIEKYYQQEFYGKLSTDLLAQCLDAGLLFLLRWSIDDHSEPIYSAAVATLSQILYVKSEQEFVQKFLFTENGFVLPQLCFYYKKKDEEMTQEEKEEDRDLLDAELVKVDVVKGLLQMQILPRLRYVIEICHPSDNAISNCVSVLIRIAQHDTESSWRIMDCPRLTEVLYSLLKNKFENFKTALMVVRFFRSLCQAGKEISKKVMSLYSINDLIYKYVSLEQVDHLFMVEIYELWRVLLHYGLASNLFQDVYMVIMTKVQGLCANYSQVDDFYAASIIHVVESAMHITDSSKISWIIIEGFFPLLVQCIKAIESEITQKKHLSYPMYVCSILQSLASYCQLKNDMVLSENPVALLETVEYLWDVVLKSFINSSLFSQLLDEICLFSDFNTKESAYLFNWPKNLPSYGTYSLPGTFPLSLVKDSPISLVQGFFKLILQLVKIHKGLSSNAVAIVTNPQLLVYIKFVLQSNIVKHINTLVSTEIECILLSHLLELFIVVVSNGKNCGFHMFHPTINDIYLQLSFLILTLPCNFSCDNIISVMKNVIFNPKMFRKKTFILHGSEERTAMVKQNVELALKELSYTANIYLDTFKLKSLNKERTSFLYKRQSLLPTDWMFYPIVKLYNSSLNIEHGGGIIINASIKTVEIIRYCVQFILMLEVTCSSILSDVSETLRFTRFMCLFLSEGCVFTDQILVPVLSSLMVVYSAPGFQSYLDFEVELPGITSYYDLYTNLLSQYLSSSFGDPTFSNLVLVPMQLKHDVKFRRAVWTEFCDILRMFPLPILQVSIDLKNFLTSDTEHEEMIEIYFYAMEQKRVRISWCPIFYLIAVHHINQYIFNPNAAHDISKRAFMLKKVLLFNDKDLRDDIVLYETLDINNLKGFRLLSQIPPSRELFIRELSS
ncbi:RNA polymerase II-associated protein 1 isoform X1 [Hydra vulgaris]|uniref:RNA polymerase II-associated protein 1 isoform X1 n=1 Tax=Hydra vulgaris TaxID=6087 RepID=UPI001F5EA365|nr:RNA polymerase II-associated protein 1 isoform X3 [Hydra vulgaris]